MLEDDVPDLAGILVARCEDGGLKVKGRQRGYRIGMAGGARQREPAIPRARSLTLVSRDTAYPGRLA
jgi:hypothetical protein